MCSISSPTMVAPVVGSRYQQGQRDVPAVATSSGREWGRQFERDWCTAFANEQQRCALGPGWCARTGGRSDKNSGPCDSPRSDAGGATQSSPRGAATRRRRLEAHPSPLCSPAPRPRWSTADLGGSAPRSRTTTTAQTHRDIITPPGPLERHELDSPASGPPAHADGRRLGHRDGQMGRPVPD